MRARERGEGKRARLAAARLDDVEEAIRQGKAGRQLERELAAQWKCTRRQARDWIQRFFSTPGDEAEAHRRSLIAVTFAAISRAIESDELRPVAALVGQAARLAGVEGPRKVELTGAGGAPLMPSDADVLRALRGVGEADLATLREIAERATAEKA